ncbi:hypothetical protein Pedsa_0964 [Pseudopedobacter saltans DSM 12145]|uniref:Nucleoid-associated protein n=1 Tax=Pseudopedobacter saltans (strain ATCC 51119 / DSM 12145 / JCM 21818 / CCUG 39354 / LMG 10337 / NBRC 100064 / NCIMB 13643) TaxID=762903 RepID=F0SAU1_PSESL|nr:nucleoid-associated protein [Pseudopedobacter saltans]ADY51536.1 hypothetical protein Pedsa_0964 [Pseudopedobacter saltans DSM 12145]
MVTFFETNLEKLVINKVGNKLQDESFVATDKQISISDQSLTLVNLLMHYFLTPFQKVQQVYRFSDHSEVKPVIEEYFTNKIDFVKLTKELTGVLYNTCNHPKIKGGEVYFTLFDNLQIEGELHRAIGIFKSESKESYLKVHPDGDGFAVDYEEQAINTHKLEKGCLIFNTDKDQGYKVVIVDETNNSKGDAAIYWKDDFLNLSVRNDNFNVTQNCLSVIKQFIGHDIDDNFEISQTDKAALLNKSIKYFKERESFEWEEFAEEVIGNQEASDMLKGKLDEYSEDYGQPIPETFEVSSNAVKKQQSKFKKVIKLDKDYQIHIHGAKQKIERGFDEEKGMNFYKVYFQEEN